MSTSFRPTRRGFLTIGLGAAALGTLTACGSQGTSADPSATPVFGADARMSLFGTAERQAKLQEVFSLYTKEYGGSVDAQIVANASYAEKLATEVAGGAAADVISLFHNIVADYARKDSLVDLDAWDAIFDASGLDEAAASSGVIDGKRYAVPLGDNAYAAFYDSDRLDALGISVPEPGHGWDDFIAFAHDVSSASGGDYYGTIDASGDMNLFEVWLRQRGLELYDGAALGYGASDLTDWFEMWDELRADGAAPPAGVTAESTTGGFGTSLIVTGQASNFFIYGNVLKAFQGLTPSALAITAPPVGDDASGLFVRASNWMGAYSKGENVDDAVNIIQFLINDPDAVTTLGAEFGAPPNLELRAGLDYEEKDQEFIDYVDLVASDYAEPVPSLAETFPDGSAQVQSAFLTTSQAIAAGDSSLADGVSGFVDQAGGFLG